MKRWYVRLTKREALKALHEDDANYIPKEQLAELPKWPEDQA